jgi:hypothetical protein
LVSKIDQKLASLEPSQRRFAQSLMAQLRQAAQADSIGNLRGVDANEIGKAMKELDTEFSHTMSSLFETATAKKFGSVRRQGLRGVTADETTRTPVDQLARLIVKLDSPQSLDELSRLVTPDTMQRISAHVMDDAVSASLTTTTGAGKVFDAEKFARHLGLGKPTGARRQVVASMLEKSGSPLKIGDLDDLLVAARSMAGAEIPNMSTFLARRAAIGGAGAVMGGLVVGTAIGGNIFAAGTLLATAMVIGGGKLVSRILSKPESARALVKVLDKEASQLVKREAMVRALRIGIESVRQDDTQEGLPGAPKRFDFSGVVLKNVMDALDAEHKVRESSQ